MSYMPGLGQPIQTQFTNFPAKALPGQLYNAMDYDIFVKSFPVDRDAFVFCGRMVVKSIIQSLDNGLLPTQAPYSVMLPGADEIATDLVGVVVRHFTSMMNAIDTADVANGQPSKAGFQELAMAAVLPLGCGRVVWVEQAPSVGDVTGGSDVYVAVNATNAAGVLVGQFSNAAGAGLVQVPGATWMFSKSTTTSLEPINAIILG